MRHEDGRFICIDSGTPLRQIDRDGARCGDSRHWHLRLGSGFAGAQPTASPMYRDAESSERPKPLLPKDGR
jgi:hypothetical protein